MRQGKVYSAYTVKDGGVIEAIYKMSFGNKVGVELNSYNKDTYKQIEGAWAEMIYVNSIEEAQQVVKDYIKKHNLKIDNWVGGNFWTEENE